MTDTVQLALIGAVGTAFGILITKGVDAIIRWRQAESKMEGENSDKLLARITHLESEVERLQKENAGFQREMGRMEAKIELLQGRVDKAELPQMGSATKT